MPDSDFLAIAPAPLSQDKCTDEPSGKHIDIAEHDLANRFSALPRGQHFVIAEVPASSPLNFLATANVFLEHAPSDTRLHYIAVQPRPLSRSDLSSALARLVTRWPELSNLADALQQQYPSITPGFHRQTFCSDRVVLTLLFGKTQPMLMQLNARVDAWFVNAPCNDVIERIAQLSHTQTTLTIDADADAQTETGQFRRALTALDFDVACASRSSANQHTVFAKRKILPPCTAVSPPISRHANKCRIAVIGAGLAGITSAEALARRGYSVQLFDRAGIASGASGNLAGVVYTTPSAFPTAQNRFYQSSYLFTLKIFRARQFPRCKRDGALTGVLQLAKNERLADKAQAALASGLWPSELLMNASDDGGNDGNDVSKTSPYSKSGALMQPQAGYISAPQWCDLLAREATLSIEQKNVSCINRVNNQWQLTCDDDSRDFFDHVIIANAAAATELVPLPSIKLKNIRGQVSYVEQTAASKKWIQATCHAGYLTPAIDGLHCVGATFDIGDSEAQTRPSDDVKNIAQLKEYLPAQWQELGGNNISVHSQRVAFRCQSTDFLPLAGPLEAIDDSLKGLWLNIAHGSRGITGTPLCAELLACMINNEPLPIDNDMTQALSPARFAKRQAKKK